MAARGDVEGGECLPMEGRNCVLPLLLVLKVKERFFLWGGTIEEEEEDRSFNVLLWLWKSQNRMVGFRMSYWQAMRVRAWGRRPQKRRWRTGCLGGCRGRRAHSQERVLLRNRTGYGHSLTHFTSLTRSLYLSIYVCMCSIRGVDNLCNQSYVMYVCMYVYIESIICYVCMYT